MYAVILSALVAGGPPDDAAAALALARAARDRPGVVNPVPNPPAVAPKAMPADPYAALLARVAAGETVRVASGVDAPAGFEAVTIPGKIGLFECRPEPFGPGMRGLVPRLVGCSRGQCRVVYGYR